MVVERLKAHEGQLEHLSSSLPFLLEDKINHMYASIDNRINGVSRCEGYVGYLEIVTACHLLRTQFKICVQSRDRSKFELMSVLPTGTTSYFERSAVHLLHQVDTYGRSGHFDLLLKRDTPPNSLITEVAQIFEFPAGFSDAREPTLVQFWSDVLLPNHSVNHPKMITQTTAVMKIAMMRT